MQINRRYMRILGERWWWNMFYLVRRRRMRIGVCWGRRGFVLDGKADIVLLA